MTRMAFHLASPVVSEIQNLVNDGFQNVLFCIGTHLFVLEGFYHPHLQ